MKPFLERLDESQPMTYDGGFGAGLFDRGVELTNSSLANHLHPKTVVEIHRAYIAAGAEAIGTNTFVASGLHLEMAGKNDSDVEPIICTAVEHARLAVEQSKKQIYIAGSIGPSPGAIETDSGDTVFGIANDKARAAHEKAATAMADNGVDFFCVETQFSANEAALIVDVLRQFSLPIAVNLTYKYTKDRKTGDIVYKTDWGHQPADLVEILGRGECAGGVDLLEFVQILGTNCGAESNLVEHTGMPYAVQATVQLREALESRGITSKRIMAYPNAGVARLDKVTRRTFYDQSPEEMAQHIPSLVEEGAFIVGGCCGTGPEHISAFCGALAAS
jgi:methionine synthase I (cobalamin-dependent)